MTAGVSFVGAYHGSVSLPRAYLAMVQLSRLRLGLLRPSGRPFVLLNNRPKRAPMSLTYSWTSRFSQRLEDIPFQKVWRDGEVPIKS